ncbi:UNVERIFIED_CONTAM: aldose 1-epimerase [Acetivibrio alkalicellulosi]
MKGVINLSVFKEKFIDDKDIHIFVLKNSNGMKAKITNYGGIITSLYVPDKEGRLDDVVLGYDKLCSYYKNRCFYGGIIGRHANRIENSTFELNGQIYNLVNNEKINHIHGGSVGFDGVVWDWEIVNKNSAEGIKLTYKSYDGEENYPGNLDVEVTYWIGNDNSLNIEYYAVSDKDTVVNLTNHTYFNLSGHGLGDILDHQVMINADSFTPTDEFSLPTGEIRKVFETPMDFTKIKSVREDINSNYTQIIYGKGFDHNWVLNTKSILEKAAEVFDPASKRRMEVYTTKPGIQFYSGNNILRGDAGKDGAKYIPRSGLCLETQYFPNSLKHKHFPSPILKAGEEYKHTTIYKFV